MNEQEQAFKSLLRLVCTTIELSGFVLSAEPLYSSIRINFLIEREKLYDSFLDELGILLKAYHSMDFIKGYEIKIATNYVKNVKYGYVLIKG